jgi:hypothetical protein
MVLCPLIIGSPDFRTELSRITHSASESTQFYRASDYKSHHARNKGGGGQSLNEELILTEDVEFYRKGMASKVTERARQLGRKTPTLHCSKLEKRRWFHKGSAADI